MPWADLVRGAAYLAPSLWAGRCSCHCSGSPDERVLSILERQLDRCGPEQLRPPEPGRPWVLLVAVSLLAGAFGFLGGALATGGVSLPCPRRGIAALRDTERGRPVPIADLDRSRPAPLTPSTRRLRDGRPDPDAGRA